MGAWRAKGPQPLVSLSLPLPLPNPSAINTVPPISRRLQIQQELADNDEF
jgi:hypothetical protein